MKHITNPDAIAGWELQPEERLMVSNSKIENGVLAPLPATFLAYGYIPNSGPNQYRELGECDADGFKLAADDTLPVQQTDTASTEQEPSEPTTDTPAASAEVPLPE